jgi:tetratricopeptide (TPR) repeat protein
MNKKITVILPLIFLFISSSIFAETIILKSGKTIEGKILEKTDKYIKIDLQGVPLTYFLDEIESIDGAKLVSSSEGKEVKVNVNISDPNIAVGYYEAAIKNNPNDFSSYNNLGMAYVELNQLQKALDCFQKATEINPNSAESYAYLGATYNSLKQPEKAILYLKKAIDLGSTDIRTYSSLGGSYFFTGKFSEAIPYFEKVVQLNPKDIKAYIALANTYKALGNYQKARESFLKLKELYREQGDDAAVQEVEGLVNDLPK